MMQHNIDYFDPDEDDDDDEQNYNQMDDYDFDEQEFEENIRRHKYGLPDLDEERLLGFGGSSIQKESQDMALIRHYDAGSPRSESPVSYEIKDKEGNTIWSSGITDMGEYAAEGVSGFEVESGLRKEAEQMFDKLSKTRSSSWSPVLNLRDIEKSRAATGGNVRQKQDPFKHEVIGIIDQISSVQKSDFLSEEDKKIALSNLNQELSLLETKSKRKFDNTMREIWEAEQVEAGKLRPR